MRILFPLQETLVKNLPKTSSGSIDWVATYQAVRESNCSSLKRFYHLHSAKFLRARISLWDFYKGIRLAKSTLAEDTETSSPEQDDKRTVRVARLPTLTSRKQCTQDLRNLFTGALSERLDNKKLVFELNEGSLNLRIF